MTPTGCPKSHKSALLPPPLVELQKLAGLASNASVSNWLFGL